MSKATLHIFNRQFEMPQTWNDLTRRQLVKIAAVLQHSELTMQQRLHVFRICAGMPWFYFHQLAHLPKWLAPKVYWKKLETLLFVSESLYMLDFLTTTNTLTVQLLPSISPRFSFRRFYGPVANFENLTMEEFSYAELFYLAYRERKDPDDLRKLVATLYRPAKQNYDKKLNPAGDVREKFNEHVIDHRARRLRKVNANTMLAVLFWYEGCRGELANLFPRVFDGKEGEMETFGLFSVITNVAEDGVMGNFNELKLQYVHVVLLRLTELLIKAEHLERQHEEQLQQLQNQR